ncbi:MAG: NeuD/PglB/VioB family sugar acetyltransferase [Candidatus Omnitrophica bacterium]|nr:NeuD/PglB/VioB family sugar acetyltransferase [Candidatus Omnitrophota bacterium]
MPKDKIVIIGAGGFGREVCRWVMDMYQGRKDVVEGFYDDNPRTLEKFPDLELSVIGNTAFSEARQDVLFVCSIGNVENRERLFMKIKKLGGRFLTVIHPSAIMSPNCRIGEGAIIGPGVVISERADIGKNAVLNIGVICGHDVIVGAHSNICPGVNINGEVEIKPRVFIGSSAVITPRAVIPEDCDVSAGSVVYKKSDLKSGMCLHGNPAKLFPKMRKH